MRHRCHGFSNALLLAAALCLSARAQAPSTGPHLSPIPCPMVIGLARNGTLHTNRGQSWFRTSHKLLESDLAGGCYPEGGFRPVSSVRLFVAPRTPAATVDDLLALLARDGWPKSRITAEPWPNPPNFPAAPTPAR